LRRQLHYSFGALVGSTLGVRGQFGAPLHTSCTDLMSCCADVLQLHSALKKAATNSQARYAFAAVGVHGLLSSAFKQGGTEAQSTTSEREFEKLAMQYDQRTARSEAPMFLAALRTMLAEAS